MLSESQNDVVLIFPDWLRPGIHASGLAQFLDFVPVFSGAEFLAGTSRQHQLAVMPGLSQIKVLTRAGG
jgi:hypothetical protein